jgi:hypothetical protein
MTKKYKLGILSAFFLISISGADALLLLAQPTTGFGINNFDVVVVGGTPAGIMAAIAAERDGKNVLLLERTDHIGGLPANGLGATDLATRGATGGLFAEFIQRIRNHYINTYGENSQQVIDSSDGYHFEPSVAEMIFEQMLSEHENITVLRMIQFDAEPRYVSRVGNTLHSITVLNRITNEREIFRGKIFIDATYEGDLAAASGVQYHVGREGADEFGEPFAGRLYKHWAGPLSDNSTGLGDNAVQAYNFRLPLTNRAENMVPFTRPVNYNRNEYLSLIDDVITGRHTGVEMIYVTDEDRMENVSRIEQGLPPLIPGGHHQLNGIGRLTNQVTVPNSKTDSNNQHLAFISTNLPEENWPWPTSDWDWRDKYAERLKNYITGLFWFAQNDPELPEWFKENTRPWGLSKDEYQDNDHFPRQVYVREGRRIKGMHFFTAHDAIPVQQGMRPPVYHSSITASHYALDSHSTRKREEGQIHLEGFFSSGTNIEYHRYHGNLGTRPYTVPYGVIVPQNVSNLLVPVAVSGTHVGFSTLRMEPCWMALGEAAGVAAVLSIYDKVPVQHVSISRMQRKLLQYGAVLIYFTDISAEHENFKALNYFGVRGFIPEWEARPDQPVSVQQAETWIQQSGVLDKIEYDSGITTRGQLLQLLYGAKRD